MLSSVLRSQRAVEVNIAIMRTFVQLRRLMDSNRDLAQKIGEMEEKYDGQFSIVFDAIRSSSVRLPRPHANSVSTPSRRPSPRRKPPAPARNPEIRSLGLPPKLCGRETLASILRSLAARNYQLKKEDGNH